MLLNDTTEHEIIVKEDAFIVCEKEIFFIIS